MSVKPPPPPSRLRRPGPLDAGPFAADVASFGLHLAAENKATGTIRIYTEAPRWFAAAHLLPETGKTRWEQVDTQDVQRWLVWLLRHYSENYACQQYRSLQQFFRWLAAEDEVPDPMGSLRAPHVAGKPVPFFTSGELSKLERACRGNTFAQRRGHPPGRAGRDPLPPRRPRAQRRGRAAAGGLRPEQARQGPGPEDRPRGGPPPRPLPAGAGRGTRRPTGRGGGSGPATAGR